MFSGQGSQYFQMGKELYKNHSSFKFWMDHCDEIVKAYLQISLIDILYRYHGKTEPFDQILYTNPALLCVEYSLAQVLIEMDIQPDFLLGYSLGEITACVVSGIVSLEHGIRIVVDMAKLIERNTKSAKMLSIIESQNVITDFSDLFQRCWLTGINFQNNFVVCGSPDDIHQLQKDLGLNNIVSQILPVNYGFHTKLMDSIERDLKELVGKINLRPIGIDIISSTKCGLLEKEVDEKFFWELIRQPVHFEKTIKWVLKKGDFIFIDAGPSGSLSTFVKYILPNNSSSLSLQMINQFGKDLTSLKKLKNGIANYVLH